MHLFHLPDLSMDRPVLPEEEAHHAVHVLRLRAGDHVGLLDGRGGHAVAELEEVSKRTVSARVLELRQDPPEVTAGLHLAVAPTKQMDRYEWFVEKAVEVGVGRITPLLTARTERSKLRVDRLERVAVSAMKQSQRTWLPRIDGPTTLPDLLRQELPAQRLFGWCEGEHRSLMEAFDPKFDALVVIGPEGDLHAEEALLLRGHGGHAVSLGAARLRTETAAVVACTWMSLARQR